MRASTVLSLATVLLAACGSTPEMTAYREDPIMALSTQYGPGCEKLGYGKGTEQWRHCIAGSSRHDDLARYGLFYDRYMSWYLLRQ